MPGETSCRSGWCLFLEGGSERASGMKAAAAAAANPLLRAARLFGRLCDLNVSLCSSNSLFKFFGILRDCGELD